MGAMQTVYHDRLQMSVCGQATPLWKRSGQRKEREDKYSKDERGGGPEFLSSSQVHLWSVMDMMGIDFQVNCFTSLSLSLSLGGTNCNPPPPNPSKRSLCSAPRSTSLIAHFNIPTVSAWRGGGGVGGTRSPPTLSRRVEHYLSIKAAPDSLINKMKSNAAKRA